MQSKSCIRCASKALQHHISWSDALPMSCPSFATLMLLSGLITIIPASNRSFMYLRAYSFLSADSYASCNCTCSCSMVLVCSTTLWEFSSNITFSSSSLVWESCISLAVLLRLDVGLSRCTPLPLDARQFKDIKSWNEMHCLISQVLTADVCRLHECLCHLGIEV